MTTTRTKFNFDRLRRVTEALDFERAIRGASYAQIGEALADKIDRPRAFSRSYTAHVLLGHYAPARPMRTALGRWFGEAIAEQTERRVVGRLRINGEWRVDLKCKRCHKPWRGRADDVCRCEKARR